MKYTIIKSALLRTMAVLLFIFGSISASAQYYQMKVRTFNGQVTRFNTDQIDSIYFELVEPEDNGNDVNDVNETTVTGNATDITNYTASISSWANILDNLSTDLKVGIIYTQEGTPSKSNGTQKTVSTLSIGGDAKYTILLTDLAPSTTYYYRSFVYQSGIWFYGNVKSFTTKKGQGVELVSGEVSKLTCYSAKISGAVSIDESTQYRTLSYGICYSTDSTPTVNSTILQASSKDQDGNFTVQLRALSGSTTYYYRSYAYVDSYLSYGPIRSFTTKDDDVVITGDIDTTTYSVKSTLKIGSGAYSSLELGVCYGINSTPTVNDWKVTTNEVDDENNFTLSLKDVPFGTAYYRSFVKIDGVAHYGEIKSFEVALPDVNGYEYVDLGLSVLWATCNVGATMPEGYGDYYAWGETEPKIVYSGSTYKYFNGSSSTLTKYCNSSSYGNNGYTDTKTTLDPDDDVAHVKWGGDWRMPTKDEFTELRNNCTWTWITLNGVKGYRVTSKKSGYTDRSIFLPAVGYRSDTGLYDVGSDGYYWSSSLYTDYPDYAWYLNFYSDYYFTINFDRSCGLSVRPVCP